MARLALSLIGPLNLRMNGEPVQGLEADKVRALLAYLAVEQTHAHRREALGELLWPERSIDAVRNNLRKALFRLRRALGDEEMATPYFLTTQKTIQWNTTGDTWVDVVAFEALVEMAREHQHPQMEHCESCASLLKQVAELYRGDFLLDVYVGDSAEFEEWVLVKRESLRRQALEALEMLSEYHGARREFTQAVDYARRRTKLDPLSEEAHRHLMEILALAGRRPEALEQYRICCNSLAEELGLEPGRETIELWQHIVSGTLQCAEVQPSPPIHNLPAQVTSFVGRDVELAQLVKQLQEPSCRLITIGGIGGVGKTRLALVTAERVRKHFLHGVWFVDLSGMSANTASERNADTLAAAIGQSLGFEFSGGGAPTSQILKYLRPLKMLLILDNFEVMMSSAGYLAEILRGAADVTLLVTSRERLKLQAEHLLQLNGLAIPPSDLFDGQRRLPVPTLLQYEAVTLFIQRAQASNPAFEMTVDNAPFVAEICIRLDGLPLALELAAARTRILAPQSMLERLPSRLKILTGGAHDLPARHQTLRNTIDWSYYLLQEVERTLFARLSVFAGGWTLDAAEAICGENLPMAVLDGLESLADKSLVQQGVGKSGEPRFIMLETVREYAAEKLEQVGESNSMRARHAHYLAALSERAGPALAGGTDQPQWFRWLDDEQDNIRAAMSWALGGGSVEVAMKIGAPLWRYYRLRLGLFEFTQWLRSALAHDPGVSLALRAKTLRSCSNVMTNIVSQIDQVNALEEEALALYRQLGDQEGMEAMLSNIAVSTYRAGDFVHARPIFEKTLVMSQSRGDEPAAAATRLSLAVLDVLEGHYEEAEPILLEALDFWKRINRLDVACDTLSTLGIGALWVQNTTRAHRYFQEALEIARDLDDVIGIPWLLMGLGLVLLLEGDTRQARQELRASLQLAMELPQDDTETLHLIPLHLLWLGGTALTDDPQRAGRLLGAGMALETADALTLWPGIRVWPGNMVIAERLIAETRACLDPAVFDRAWAEGQAMSREQAVVYALD